MRLTYLLGKKILARRLPEVAETRSGLHLPSVARERPQLAHVVAISDFAARTTGLVVGSIIMFPKFHDRTVWIDDEEYLILDHAEPLVEIVD